MVISVGVPVVISVGVPGVMSVGVLVVMSVGVPMVVSVGVGSVVGVSQRYPVKPLRQRHSLGCLQYPSRVAVGKQEDNRQGYKDLWCYG